MPEHKAIREATEQQLRGVYTRNRNRAAKTIVENLGDPPMIAEVPSQIIEQLILADINELRPTLALAWVQTREATQAIFGLNLARQRARHGTTPVVRGTDWADDRAEATTRARYKALLDRLGKIEPADTDAGTRKRYIDAIYAHWSRGRIKMAARTITTEAITAGELDYVEDLDGMLGTDAEDAEEEEDFELIEARRQIIPGRIQIIWFTRDDERVCPICEPLHSFTQRKWRQVAPNGPPAHPNCRCWLRYLIPNPPAGMSSDIIGEPETPRRRRGRRA